jgi:FtsP/CotA-like multicopper oxidase with cupredoxin domain
VHPLGRLGGLLIAVLAAGAQWACGGSGGAGGAYTPPAFSEPVTLASADGVLEVRLFVRQGTASLNTVAAPAQNFLPLGYQVIRGTASNGRASDHGLYPGPTLQVDPGETLIIHLHNELVDLTIRDFFDPALTPAGAAVPLYPRQLPSAPFNVHVHGLHVSPKGNSDNVLLSIPGGYTNTYTYRIPTDHPQGMFWYHSHRHQVTSQETYLGACGLLSIGRSDGNLPLVTERSIPIRNMALQYNFVFDRQGGQATLNNPTWPQWLSTLTEPVGTQLADGSYEPKLTPTNFVMSDPGTKFLTVWYAGSLSTSNNRGEFALMPSNLQRFTGSSGLPADDLPADPSLPDHLRDVQYTVNALFQPTLEIPPSQTEIWVLANISDFAYFNIRLTETATGRHPPIAIVGVDGEPDPEVHYPLPPSDGTTLVIPPASRYALAVTMPERGDLVLEMPPATGQAAVSGPGILYTNDGTDQSPAVLGTIDIDGSTISYYDGFFYYPTQVLARARPASGPGVTTEFVAGQKTDAYTSFFDTEGLTPDVTRTIVASGGFDNTSASADDPKAFVYEFDGNTFPYVALIQPRLESLEEWTFVNMNNDGHPIHVHVNDFQVSRIVDPRSGVTTGFQHWAQDNANLPVPLTDADRTVTEPSELSIRSKFVEFTGTFVTHCHRLNHEDNGMMLIVNVIPAVSSFAVAESGAPGRDAEVRVYDGDGDRLLATVRPFPGFEGSLSVAMGDVDGDQVLDLIAGAGPGGTPHVAAFSGTSGAGDGPFERELLRFLAFEPGFRGGVSVAAADIDGNALADNVIVGSGPGIETSVKVYGSVLPESGSAPDLFAEFTPYPDSAAGVTVTAGLFDAMAGRDDIVTAPGPGTPAEVKSFRYDLYTPNAALETWCAPDPALVSGQPRLTSELLAFDAAYTGGVSLGSGWIAGAEGGAQSLVVGQLGEPGIVRVFTTGSALFGQPSDYLESPDDHDETVTFEQVADFAPFADGSGAGVRVATTSDVHGATLLVSGRLVDDGYRTAVRKYDLVRRSSSATTLEPVLLGEVESLPGALVPAMGGNG